MLEHDSGGTCSASIIPVYNIESYLQRYIRRAEVCPMRGTQGLTRH